MKERDPVVLMIVADFTEAIERVVDKYSGELEAHAAKKLRATYLKHNAGDAEIVDFAQERARRRA